MEANQQSVRAQQTRADRGSIQEWVRRTDDIICSQQSRLTSTWLQGLRDNTSFPQNFEGIFQPSSTALLPCLRRQALGKLHRLPSHRTVAAPVSHEPEFGRFPCTTPAPVWFTGGPRAPPKYLRTHIWSEGGERLHYRRAFPCCSQKAQAHYMTMVEATYPGMREGHQCGQTWRTWGRRGRRPISCSPWASSNESPHQGGKELSQRWRSKEEDEAREWDVDMEAATTKASGETTPPERLLPQTPRWKAARERNQEGTVYWWNTTGRRSRATPRSWETAAAGGSPLLLFLSTARFLYNPWRNTAAPEGNSSYPRTAIWARWQRTFP